MGKKDEGVSCARLYKIAKNIPNIREKIFQILEKKCVDSKIRILYNELL